MVSAPGPVYGSEQVPNLLFVLPVLHQNPTTTLLDSTRTTITITPTTKIDHISYRTRRIVHKLPASQLLSIFGFSTHPLSFVPQ